MELVCLSKSSGITATCIPASASLSPTGSAENVDHGRYLARPIELDMNDREARMVGGGIKAAKFPAIKSLETFDFDAIS
jgi:hypothetical protein